MSEIDYEKEELRQMIEEKAVLPGDFKSSAGLDLKRYFDLKKVLHLPRGIKLTGKLVLGLITAEEIKFIGGYGHGGGLITSAVITTAGIMRESIHGFDVTEREKLRKGDPRRRWERTKKYVVTGFLPPPGGEVAVVDDVISTGRSLLIAIRVVERRGCRVVKVVVLLDRHLGGSDKLRKKGYDFTALFSADSEGNITIN